MFCKWDCFWQIFRCLDNYQIKWLIRDYSNLILVWTGSFNTTNRDLFSLDPFASPHNLDRELHSLLAKASSYLCDWFADSGSQGPMPDSFDLPEVTPSKEGVSNKVLLRELQLLMNGSYRPSHPGSLAHFDPPPLSASIVGELICAGLNNNLLAEELSPSV